MIAGEYGILLGFHPALACTIDRFLDLEMEVLFEEPPGITVCSDLYSQPLRSTWEELTLQSELCFKALSTFLLHHPQCLYSLRSSQLRITLNSDLPAGWGVGSSAAVSLGCVLALGDILNLSLSSSEARDLASQAQKSFQQGYSSGYDVLTQLLGGAVWCERAQHLGEVSLGGSSSARHLNYLKKTITLWGQEEKTTPTGNLISEVIPTLLRGQEYTPLSLSCSQLTEKDLSALGRRVISAQKNLLLQLKNFAPVSELTQAFYECTETLQGFPGFPLALYEDLKKLPGYKRDFAWKPSGAGGNDLSLVVGSLPLELKETLRAHGLEPATTLSCEKARKIEVIS